MTENPFKILGVDPSSELLRGFTPENLLQVAKAQFKALAILLHPDRNKSKNASTQFQLIKEAVDVLDDPEAFEYWRAQSCVNRKGKLKEFEESQKRDQARIAELEDNFLSYLYHLTDTNVGGVAHRKLRSRYVKKSDQEKVESRSFFRSFTPPPSRLLLRDNLMNQHFNAPAIEKTRKMLSADFGKIRARELEHVKETMDPWASSIAETYEIEVKANGLLVQWELEQASVREAAADSQLRDCPEDWMFSGSRDPWYWKRKAKRTLNVRLIGILPLSGMCDVNGDFVRNLIRGFVAGMKPLEWRTEGLTLERFRPSLCFMLPDATVGGLLIGLKVDAAGQPRFVILGTLERIHFMVPVAEIVVKPD